MQLYESRVLHDAVPAEAGKTSASTSSGKGSHACLPWTLNGRKNDFSLWTVPSTSSMSSQQLMTSWSGGVEPD